MPTIKEFQAQQTAQFYQQKSNDAAHDAAFIGQSWHQHVAPQNTNFGPGHNARVIRSGVGRPTWNFGPSPTPAAELQQVKSQHAAQVQQGAMVEQAQLAAEIRGLVQQVKNQMAQMSQAGISATVRRSVQQAQPQQRQAPPQEQLPISPVTKKPSKLRAMINRSVGM